MEQTNKQKGLRTEQKQQLKKYLVFTLLFLVFGGSMWLIFKPSGEKIKDTIGKGLNTELPMPKEEGIIPDKIKAFEHAKLFQEKPVRSLESFSSLVGNKTKPEIDLSLDKTGKPLKKSNRNYSASKQPQRAITNSATAYKGINHTLGNFYDKSKTSPKDDKLRKEIADLKAQLEEKPKMNSTEEQLLLMEKSYQLASKYMPGSSQQNMSTELTKSRPPADQQTDIKAKPEPVKTVGEQTVSFLPQTESDSVFMQKLGEPRNLSFITISSKSGQKDKNTIWACVNNNQKLISGQNVKLRLLEPVESGGLVFPKHAVITGIAQIKGERLHIYINSLEYNSSIIPVQLSAYDTDGQQGLFIPGSMELNAVKEITASMGSNAGTSINVTQGQTAGQQLLADAGRSLIQGTSQYISKKMRTTKVTLKAGYRVLLMPQSL